MKAFTRSERAFIEALYALLQKKHINDIHVTDILRLSGFTKGAFYGRFEDKNDFIKKIILQVGANHREILERAGVIMKKHRNVHNPDNIKNSDLFFEHVYNNRFLLEMILERKLCANSVELFLYGEEYLSVFRQSETAILDNQASDIINEMFGLYTSLVYILFWQSIGYDHLKIQDLTRLVLPIQQTLWDHNLDIEKN